MWLVDTLGGLWNTNVPVHSEQCSCAHHSFCHPLGAGALPASRYKARHKTSARAAREPYLFRATTKIHVHKTYPAAVDSKPLSSSCSRIEGICKARTTAIHAQPPACRCLTLALAHRSSLVVVVVTVPRATSAAWQYSTKASALWRVFHMA